MLNWVLCGIKGIILMYKTNINNIKSKFNKIVFSVLAVAISIAMCFSIYIVCHILYEKSFFHANRVFMKQIENFEMVRDYFAGTDYRIIRWDDSKSDILEYAYDNTKGGINSFNCKLEDSNLLSALKQLSKNGIKSIIKNGNYVTFEMTEYLDSGYGLVYCKEYPVIKYNGEVNIKQIDGNDWYYYAQVAD